MCTYDLGQDSPIQTDIARLIRCFLYGENKNNFIRLMNWFVLTDILLENGDEPNLILPKFAHPPHLFSHQLFATYRTKLGYLKDSNAAAHSVDSDIFYVVMFQVGIITLIP